MLLYLRAALVLFYRSYMALLVGLLAFNEVPQHLDLSSFTTAALFQVS